MANFLDKIVSNSVRMQQVCKELEPFINNAAPLLFCGEPGNGKGFFARAVHEASRAGNVFLRKPGFELEEDTVKQQFLGIGNRTGWLEEADRGTILINRIEDAALTIQHILWQLLSNQSSDGSLSFSRTRSTETLQVNVRLMFSMACDHDTAMQDEVVHRDLLDLIRNRGKIVILPPLRERKEDIVAIATHLFDKLNQEYNQQVAYIDVKAQELLTNYPWLGNIDELRRELAGIFSQYPGMTTITAEHIPKHIAEPQIPEGKFSFKLKSGEKFAGTFRIDVLLVQKNTAKLQIKVDDLVEIKRVEDDFTPPRLKYFEFKLKDGSNIFGMIVEKTLTIETSFDPYHHIDVLQDLSSVTLL